MASLNLSINGPSIKSSYAGVVNGNATSPSPTHCQWALFSVQAPLVSAFQEGGAKESVLKVDSTGGGELSNLIEELNEGRIQFCFVKVKDPNTALPKYVLIAWCGGGVPERTKGYFTNHLAVVSKILHGYHVQITARSESDLDPATIMKKVAEASGANYSGGSAAGIAPPAPPTKAKPVFTPTNYSAGRPVDPLVAARSQRDTNVDADGWGSNAPPVTRTQIEKVASAYQPTKVNMAELTSQKSGPSRPAAGSRQDEAPSDVVKGGYQPVGKVDIAAIRAQAQKTGDDRPIPVKGSYEPVGKVDIAAIRAQAKKPNDYAPVDNQSLVDRTAAFSDSQVGRLTALPKPKVAKKFPGASAITGTRAPAPGVDFGGPAGATVATQAGSTSRTFADEGGKTPAQVWAEKKARERGESIGSVPVPSAAPVVPQKSGNEWKSGYTGKSWAPVQTGAATRAPQDAEFMSQQHTGEAARQASAEPESPARVSALRDQFKNTVPMSAAAPPTRSVEQEEEAPPPPPLPASTRPTGGFALPGLPSRPPPVDDEEEVDDASAFEPPAPPAPPVGREQSPIRVAAPVSRGVLPLTEEPVEPQHAPVHEHVAHELAAENVAHEATEHAYGHAAVSQSGQRALVQYDYEKAEDNEIDLVEGQYVTHIDQVDDDWWLGTNSIGETGLFPSNYVELVEDEEAAAPAAPPAPRAPEPEPTAAASHAPEPAVAGPTATALYDYEAAEDNELSFPEDAKITNLEFPDEDWWFGHHGGQHGLFPANYVQLDA